MQQSLCPQGGAPSAHWLGGQVVPEADLDAVDIRKIQAPVSNQTQVVQNVPKSLY